MFRCDRYIALFSLSSHLFTRAFSLPYVYVSFVSPVKLYFSHNSLSEKKYVSRKSDDSNSNVDKRVRERTNHNFHFSFALVLSCFLSGKFVMTIEINGNH